MNRRRATLPEAWVVRRISCSSAAEMLGGLSRRSVVEVMAVLLTLEAFLRLLSGEGREYTTRFFDPPRGPRRADDAPGWLLTSDPSPSRDRGPLWPAERGIQKRVPMHGDWGLKN